MGQYGNDVSISELLVGKSNLTPAAAKLTKRDLVALATGHENEKTDSLTVRDLRSISRAFSQNTGAPIEAAASCCSSSVVCCCCCGASQPQGVEIL